MPITWDQLDATAPDAFELGDLPPADPLEALLVAPAELSAALAKAQQMAQAAGVQVEPFDRFRS